MPNEGWPTADERDALRADIARTRATERDAIETQYSADVKARQLQYQKDIHDNRVALEEDYVAAGLNPDGSDPQRCPQGSTV